MEGNWAVSDNIVLDPKQTAVGLEACLLASLPLSLLSSHPLGPAHRKQSLSLELYSSTVSLFPVGNLQA